MIYCLLFLITFFSLWMCFSFKIKQISLLAGINIFTFFSEYVIVSGFYFWADSFSILKSLITMLIINAIIFFVLFLKHKKIATDYESVKFDLPLITILLLCIPLSAFKFGYFGMGQDEGVYQVKAIDLMYTDTMRQKSFFEYDDLADEEKEQYFAAVKKLAGYDIYDIQKPTCTEDELNNPADGIYHGIPTFAAILALSGSMFGVENISALNTLIYIGIILLMNSLCNKFCLNTIGRFASVMIAALSPVVLWVTKSTLTELFLALIIISYLYFITAESDFFNVAMSVISVWAFAFFHVTIFTVIPYFIVCYMILYLKNEKKLYFFSAVSAGGVSIIGLCMMLFTSPVYTTNNIVRHVSAFITLDDFNCIPAISVMILIFLGLFVMVVWVKPLKEFLAKFITTNFFANIIRTACILLVIVCGYRCIKSGLGVHEVVHSFKTNGLTAFAYMTGIVVLPVVLVMLVVKMHKLLQELPAFLIVFSFFYHVLFRSAFLNASIPHYYYYSRYLAPYVSIVAILFGILVTKKIITSVVAVCSAGFMLPYDLAMFDAADDTRMDWENLLDITEYIDENDAVIVSENCMVTFFIPIKEMTGADVFPKFGMDLVEQCEQLSRRYDVVHVISDEDYYLLSDAFAVEYRDTVHESQDLQQYRNNVIPLPYMFYRADYDINMVKFSSEPLSYSISLENVVRSGFQIDSSFLWSVEENSEIFIPKISDDALKVELLFAEYIPISSFDTKSYPIDVSINGNFYATLDLASQNSITILLSESDMTENSGAYIQFRSDLWCPSDYGSSDSRHLGFPLKSVLVRKNDGSLIMSFADGTLNTSGFGNIEKNLFAWSTAEKADVRCHLEQADYNLSVKCMPYIDFGLIGIESYTIDVYMNNNYIGEMVLNRDKDSYTQTFSVPMEYIRKNENLLSFRSTLWSPADYGASDTRKLGFALSSVSFKKQE